MRRQRICPFLLSILLVSCAPGGGACQLAFDGLAAYEHVLAQCHLGPRPTGSAANRLTADYIVSHLDEHGWAAEAQDFVYRDVLVRNVVGRSPGGSVTGGSAAPVLILGAHYDTRRSADQDDPTAPVLGANDGASGVAVLLELARTLDRDRLRHQVWLAFFDAEDNGRLDGWEWHVGSSYMAAHLEIVPEAVIVVDMVGDEDQQLYLEGNSDPALQRELWQIAASLAYTDTFISEYRWTMIDDHVPFAARGIPAVDIIDFDYPYWHTTEDTPDKVSPQSLERVGRVLEHFLEGEVTR